MTTGHQQTDMHESITKQDRNNINDPQKKHRRGTVGKNILLEGLNRFNSAPTSPLVQMWIKTYRCLVWQVGFMVFCVLFFMLGAPLGSTGSGSGFKSPRDKATA